MSTSNNYGTIPTSSGSSSNRQFSPTEFLILKESIATNIIKIKSQTHKIIKINKLIGGSNDNKDLRSKLQNMKKQNNEMIKTTSSDIKKLSSIVKFSSNEGSKTNRLMLEKLVEEFHVVAEKYVGAEKALDIKIRKTVLVNVDGAEEESDDDDINMSHQQQKLINAEIKFENKLLANREERMTKIESEVIDINQIMNEISTLIQDQGEVVESITDSISAVANDVEGGVSELQKAANQQQKFRRKIIIILLIAIVVALITCFSVYSNLKN